MSDTTAVTVDGLDSRLVRIEAEVRKWRGIATAAAVLALIAMAVAARTLRTPAQIRVANASGEELVLSADQLTFFDAQRVAVVDINTEGNSGRLSLRGRDGAGAELTTQAGAAMSLRAPGNRSAEVHVGDLSTRVSLEHDDARVVLSAAGQTESTLSIGGAPHLGAVTVSSGGKEAGPRLSLAASEAKASVTLAANAHGAEVALADSASRRTITSASDGAEGGATRGRTDRQ